MEFEKLAKIIAEVLNVDANEITLDTTFVDELGADSLDVFQIIMGIEEEFDIEIPNEEAEKIVSVGDAVEAIKRLAIPSKIRPCLSRLSHTVLMQTNTGTKDSKTMNVWSFLAMRFWRSSAVSIYFTITRIWLRAK